MNQPKLLIVFIFLLTFAFQISAQDQTPKIVWKNMREVYENAKDVKPIITVKTTKPIFIVRSFDLAVLLRFNDNSNTWEKRTPLLCGFASANLVPTKLYPNKKIQVDFSDNFLDFTPSPFMPPLESLTAPKKVLKGKYKLLIYYGLSKSKINLVSESPEFEVVEYTNE